MELSGQVQTSGADMGSNASMGDSAYVGGGALTEDPSLLPRDASTGAALTHFMTLTPDFFPTPTLPANHQVSIFLPARYAHAESKLKNHASAFKRSLLRSFTLNDQSQYNEKYSEKNGAQVWLHKKGAREMVVDEKTVLPKYFLGTRAASPEETAEELEDDFIGLLKTKLYGRPGFLQDEIFEPPNMMFCLQIFEADLVAVDPAYEGIFGDGAWALKNSKPIRLPVFFLHSSPEQRRYAKDHRADGLRHRAQADAVCRAATLAPCGMM